MVWLWNKCWCIVLILTNSFVQVQNVMNDKSLNINMSPVEIYKAWISQKETETGEARFVLINSYSVFLNCVIVASCSCHLTYRKWRI